MHTIPQPHCCPLPPAPRHTQVIDKNADAVLDEIEAAILMVATTMLRGEGFTYTLPSRAKGNQLYVPGEPGLPGPPARAAHAALETCVSRAAGQLRCAAAGRRGPPMRARWRTADLPHMRRAWQQAMRAVAAAGAAAVTALVSLSTPFSLLLQSWTELCSRTRRASGPLPTPPPAGKQ